MGRVKNYFFMEKSDVIQLVLLGEDTSQKLGKNIDGNGETTGTGKGDNNR